MLFDKKIEDQAKEHAKISYPFESVGAVLQKEGETQYLPLENIAEDKRNHFLVKSEDLCKIMPYLKGVIHSHCKEEKDNDVLRIYPSQADMESQIALNVPFGITYTDGEIATDILWWGDGVPTEPLEGRYFIHGVQDCYSLVRDFYREKLGITLKEFPRDWEWWHKGQDLYNRFGETGFKAVPLSQMKYGDLILMAVTPETIRKNIPCHGALYLDNELILHHMSGNSPYDKGRLSCKTPISRYLDKITHVLRHEENK